VFQKVHLLEKYFRVGQNHICTASTGGVKDQRVNRNIDYMFGILTSRAIDWYINELIMRGSGGGSGNFGGGSRILLGHFHEILIYSWNPQLKPSRLAPLLSDMINGGVWS